MSTFLLSLSLSEDEHNNDTLSIKPPQPQAESYPESKQRKRREHSSSYLQSMSQKDTVKYSKRSREYREERKEAMKSEEKERRSSHDSKHEERRGSRLEDLRERLDRERQSKKPRDPDMDYESSSHKRVHEHKSLKSRRDKASTRTDSSDAGAARPKDYYNHNKESSKQKKVSDNVSRSSTPEDSHTEPKYSDQEENVHHRKDLKYSNTVLDHSDEGIKFILKSFDQYLNFVPSGEASSSTQSPTAYYDESLVAVRDHEQPSSPEPDGESEPKRRKNEEDIEVEEDQRSTEVVEIAKVEELPAYLPAIMGCRSVGEFQCLNK